MYSCISKLMIRPASIAIILLFSITSSIADDFKSLSQTEDENNNKELEPWVHDPNLKVELVTKGLNSPSSIAFLGPNDILVLEKYEGKVHRIIDGNLLEEPLLDLPVSNKFERGMLGIAVAENDDKSKPAYIYLYFTESPTDEDGTDVCPASYHCDPGNNPLGNRLYRYELIRNNLVNPRLLLDLPAVPGPTHNGGKVVIGPDKNVYVTIGDVLGYRNKSSSSKVLNFENGTYADGRGGILRITQDGNEVGTGIIGESHPLNLYYAYGIRNSFGIDFDPVTGKLWDTENGPDYGDEINLVEPGFNSGWIEVQGIWKPAYDEIRGGDFIAGHKIGTNHEDSFEDFGENGKYSSPEFSWYNPVAPTGLTFLNSNKFGEDYQNDMFVGDYRNGNIYRFDLNVNRTELLLFGRLEDRVANTSYELEEAIFGGGFNAITDLRTGPYDGYLYVLSLGNGALYKIVPS
jgi:aldose sugar dehydrogenase